jgi:hypothetical protein
LDQTVENVDEASISAARDRSTPTYGNNARRVMFTHLPSPRSWVRFINPPPQPPQEQPPEKPRDPPHQDKTTTPPKKTHRQAHKADEPARD